MLGAVHVREWGVQPNPLGNDGEVGGEAFVATDELCLPQTVKGMGLGHGVMPDFFREAAAPFVKHNGIVKNDFREVSERQGVRIFGHRPSGFVVGALGEHFPD